VLLLLWLVLSLQALSKYFPDADSLPPLLQQLKQQYTSGTSSSNTAAPADAAAVDGDATAAAAADGSTDAAAAADSAAAAGGEGGSEGVDHAQSVAGAALGALGLMVSFLRSNMLDQALLPHAKYEQLCEGVSHSLCLALCAGACARGPRAAVSAWLYRATPLCGVALLV
jgi:hypothetical protein